MLHSELQAKVRELLTIALVVLEEEVRRTRSRYALVLVENKGIVALKTVS